MQGDPKEAPIDYLTLGEFLAALGYPVRLALLDALRFPQKAADIRLTPHRVHRGRNPDRPIARQTVQNHLNKLVDAGLVHAEQVEEGNQQTTYYVANPSRLYAMTEEVRRLSLRYAGTGQDADATGTMGSSHQHEDMDGPRLILVHGVYEGKVYALTMDTAEGGRWTVGRQKRLSISLDYDPFVSTRNAVIERKGDRFIITDLEESKNGTLVNWKRLPKGGSRQLRTGDVIGVGKSLLSFILE